jgi:hypothetical protein
MVPYLLSLAAIFAAAGPMVPAAVLIGYTSPVAAALAVVVLERVLERERRREQ